MPLDLTERLQAFPPGTVSVSAILQIAAAIRNRTLIKNCENWLFLRQNRFVGQLLRVIGTFAGMMFQCRSSGGCVMLTLDVFICQENILLYKRLLADPTISDDQRDLIGKMLAEEEDKLLNLFRPQGRGMARSSSDPSPSLQPEDRT
jgi:hypothetical protein